VALAIAHRGDPYRFRENTLEALVAAERAGADMVEIDVRRTADGAVVVVHDATLERLWDDPRAVAKLALAEVRATGVDGCRIPELREVLEAVRAPLMVDYTDADVAEPALRAIVGAGALDRVLFAGENLAGHRRIRALAPGARIALTWTDGDASPAALLDELAAEYLNPCRELVTRGLIDATHARGLSLSTWTVDEPEEMTRLLDLGVDAVITNRVADLVSLLAERADREEAPC
jgi:glycerophosphoryl diester phosphodiesterase